MDPDQPRVFLVTGANGVIGEAIARQLAAGPDREVVLVCRNRAKAETAVRAIRQSTGSERVRFELADLSRQASIAALAARWNGPLHVLINNAATTPRVREETPEGIELQFATNVMGYVWMMMAFRDLLAASGPARIINVSSFWAGGLRLDDLEFVDRRYDNDDAYRQAKQANRMLSAAFARRYGNLDIAVNSCHPGSVTSPLGRNLGFSGFETPDEGARTPVWLATDPVGQKKTGCYFEHRTEARCAFCRDERAVEALYQACMTYVD